MAGVVFAEALMVEDYTALLQGQETEVKDWYCCDVLSNLMNDSSLYIQQISIRNYMTTLVMVLGTIVLCGVLL